MAVKTQGTEMWAFNPITSVLIDLGCVTSIDGIDETVEQIDVTCLRDLTREYEAGLATPGQASFEIQFDPRNPDHVLLHQLKTAGVKLQFMIGFRHEVSGVPQVPGPSPSVDPVDLMIELPDERSWIAFTGYMANFPFAFNQNDVVRSALTIQISGAIDVIPASFEPVDPDTVTVAPSTLALDVDDTYDLEALVMPVGSPQGVSWTSSDPLVATVNPATGLVTAVDAGSATITATSTVDPLVSGTCAVTVS